RHRHRRGGDDRRHRDPARTALPQGRIRPRLYTGTLPHAAVRLRHGHRHDLEAARLRRQPRADGLPARAQDRLGLLHQGGTRLMSAASAMNDTLLQVDHLSMKFGGLVAIGDLSFQARRGEITALIGPNGAGKTTVFNCITGFYKPSEGMITLTSRDGTQYLLERLPDFQIPAKAKVARTFQNIRLFSGMTLLENLLVAQHNRLMTASGFTVLGLFGFSGYHKASAQSIELAKHWLEKADLIDRADDPAGDLPYGA